jgi:hypothetical protein
MWLLRIGVGVWEREFEGVAGCIVENQPGLVWVTGVHVRWMVKVKLGSVVMAGVSRSGGGLLRQENSEGYIVVSRVSSAACRSRFSSIVIGVVQEFVVVVWEGTMVNDGVTAKRDGRSSGRVLLLVAEVTLEKEQSTVFLSPL